MNNLAKNFDPGVKILNCFKNCIIQTIIFLIRVIIKRLIFFKARFEQAKDKFLRYKYNISGCNCLKMKIIRYITTTTKFFLVKLQLLIT